MNTYRIIHSDEVEDITLNEKPKHPFFVEIEKTTEMFYSSSQRIYKKNGKAFLGFNMRTNDRTKYMLELVHIEMMNVLPDGCEIILSLDFNSAILKSNGIFTGETYPLDFIEGLFLKTTYNPSNKDQKIVITNHFEKAIDRVLDFNKHFKKIDITPQRKNNFLKNKNILKKNLKINNDLYKKHSKNPQILENLLCNGTGLVNTESISYFNTGFKKMTDEQKHEIRSSHINTCDSIIKIITDITPNTDSLFVDARIDIEKYKIHQEIKTIIQHDQYAGCITTIYTTLEYLHIEL